MSSFEDVSRARSPLLRRPTGAGTAPGPHTAAELAALIALLSGTRSVAVGHARDANSRAAVGAFVEAWQALGRDVLAVVDWPEDAASWLRPARRLTAQSPDAWVLAGAPLGVAQLVRRLRHSTDWDPSRTAVLACADPARLAELAGDDTVHGLRGARADGGTWELRHGWLAPPEPRP
jgi:hypothetical protein